MYALAETNSVDLEMKGVECQIRIDASIQSMSWMSKFSLVNLNESSSSASSSTTAAATSTSTTGSTNLNSSIFSKTHMETEMKFDKHLYYQEGWLATGNSNCMIGCTSTSIIYNRNQNNITAASYKQSGCKSDHNKETKLKLNEISPTSNDQEANKNRNRFSENLEAFPLEENNNNVNINANDNQSTSAPAQPSQQLNLSRNQLNINRTNFNQRGHKSDIKLVRWNEPFQKLASCDSKGVIYVWVKHEGRWSIELINDRGFVVTDFAWSHDGRMAVICYKDGFVLVGSVNGQRFWSQLYDLASNIITAATWTPNDEFIVFGLSNGSMMVVDDNGTVVSRFSLEKLNGDSILSLAYNSPKFFIDEFIEAAAKRAAHEANVSRNVNGLNVSPSNETGIETTQSNANNSNNNNNSTGLLASSTASAAATAADLINLSIINQNRLRFSLNNFYFSNNANFNRYDSKLKNKINNNNYLLACATKSSGIIYLIKNLDPLVDIVVIDTHLKGVKFEWSTCGKILAVGGYLETVSCNQSQVIDDIELTQIENYVHFYDTKGKLIYKTKIPLTPKSSSLSAHNNKKRENQHKSDSEFECPIQLELSRFNDIPERFTALTWGHNDQRLFVACSNVLNVLRIFKRIPSLGLLSQLVFKSHLPCSLYIKDFILPEKIHHEIAYLFTPTIKANLPKSTQIRKFVSVSNPNNERLHCTLKRVNLNKSHDYYVLYIEYLGGLIPLLSARKISNLKPDFVIFDPVKTMSTTNKEVGMSLKKKKTFVIEYEKTSKQNKNTTIATYKKFKSPESIDSFSSQNSASLSISHSSNTLSDEGLTLSQHNHQIVKNKGKLVKKSQGYARERRKTREKRNGRLRNSKTTTKKQRGSASRKTKNDNVLVSIKSNMWGTKFKFFGHKYLPDLIGQIVYKTSLFHLQPRQMTITLEDLTHFDEPNRLQDQNKLKSTKNSDKRNQIKEDKNKPLKPLNKTPNKVFKSIDALSSYSTSSALLGLEDTISVSKDNGGGSSTKHPVNKDVRRNSTFSTLSSLIDPIETSAVGGESEMNLKEKLCAAHELVDSRLQRHSENNKNVTFEIQDQNKNPKSSNHHQQEEINLPVLTLAEDNSVELYDDYFLEPVSTGQLIKSNTLSGSIGSFNKAYDDEFLRNFVRKKNTTKLNDVNSIQSSRESGGQASSSISRRLLNILNAETVLNYIRKRKSFLKSNSLTYNGKDNHIPEEDIINEPSTNTKSNGSSSCKNAKNLSTSTQTSLITQEMPTANNQDTQQIAENKPISSSTSGNKRVSRRKNVVADQTRNRLVLHNKPPIWNENSQVYQLDFGGRVTQESAKNFQVEYCGKQVMQFGRIDTNAYTLDFEWPFTAVQAFSIALANITQRLK